MAQERIEVEQGPTLAAPEVVRPLILDTLSYEGREKGWTPVATELDEKIAPKPKTVAESSPTFDGVDSQTFTQSWGVEMVADSASLGVKPAALRIDADLRARQRRDDIEAVKLETSARKERAALRRLGIPDWFRKTVSQARPTVDEIRELSERDKAKKASQITRANGNRQVIDERRHIEEQMDGEPVSSRAYLRARTETAVVDFEAVFPADQIDPIDDADRYFATSNGEIETIPLKDVVSTARTIEFGKPKDQDPDRRVDREWLSDDRDLHPRRINAISSRGKNGKAHIAVSSEGEIEEETEPIYPTVDETWSGLAEEYWADWDNYALDAEWDLTFEDLWSAPPAEIEAERVGILLEKVDGHLDVYDAKGVRVSADAVAETEMQDGVDVELEAFELALAAADKHS